MSFPIMILGHFELLLDLEEEKAAVLNPDEFKRLLREAAIGRNGKRYSQENIKIPKDDFFAIYQSCVCRFLT